MPIKFTAWPEDAYDLPSEKVVQMYVSGFAGCIHQPEEKAALREEVMQSGGVWNGADATYAYGYSGKWEGKLVTPFVYVGQVFPGCWPGAAQGRGDCVSHGEMHSCTTTLACEIVAGKPDEVTGKIEVAPVIPAEGIQQGAFSSESFYWFRGSNGDGWSCSASARVSMKSAGCVIRKNYPELGFDLTHYSANTAGKWGRTPPPEEVRKVISVNLIRTITECDSPESIRDLLGEGYGINSCGGEGFSSTRDENGVSKRQGSWSHSMAYIGFDDRKWAHDTYGGPLVLVLNSWGKFNSGPRKINGTEISIPEGSFWAKYADVKNRDAYAHSSINGWPARNLPPFTYPGIFT